MIRLIFSLIFFFNGWRVNDSVSTREVGNCVMIAAPHTSNWDVVYMIAAFMRLKIPLRFTIKKEWMRFPLNVAIRPMGGLPVDRSPKMGKGKKSMVDVMVELFASHKNLVVMVTPEGTRKPRKKWRTGFYHTALKANVPIMLGYLDYKKKEAGIGLRVDPTGDVNKDMQIILNFYKDITPRHPKNFVLDQYHTNVGS